MAESLVSSGVAPSTAVSAVLIPVSAVLILGVKSEPTTRGMISQALRSLWDGSSRSARVIWRSRTTLGVAWVPSPNKKPR